MIIYLVRGGAPSWWNTGYGKGLQHGKVNTHLVTFVDVEYAKRPVIALDKDHGAPPSRPVRRKLAK
jgi:hypothetical protein